MLNHRRKANMADKWMDAQRRQVLGILAREHQQREREGVRWTPEALQYTRGPETTEAPDLVEVDEDWRQFSKNFSVPMDEIVSALDELQKITKGGQGHGVDGS